MNEAPLVPGRFLPADPARVASLHAKGGLSARQNAGGLGVSHSAMLAALAKLGVVCERPHMGRGRSLRRRRHLR